MIDHMTLSELLRYALWKPDATPLEKKLAELLEAQLKREGNR